MDIPRIPLRFFLLNQLVRLMPTGWKHWDNSVLFVTQTDWNSTMDIPARYTWGWAGDEELKFIDSHPEATSPTAYATRSSRGDQCLYIKKGSEIVSYIWFAYGSCCSLCGFGHNMEIVFRSLKPDQVFSYDLFTYREHRGRTVAIILIEIMFRALKDDGIKEVISLVALDNKPSLRVHMRVQARPVCMIYGYRIRNWNRVFYGPEQDSWLAQWLERFRPVKRNTLRMNKQPRRKRSGY